MDAHWREASSFECALQMRWTECASMHFEIGMSDDHYPGDGGGDCGHRNESRCLAVVSLFGNSATSANSAVEALSPTSSPREKPEIKHSRSSTSFLIIEQSNA